MGFDRPGITPNPPKRARKTPVGITAGAKTGTKSARPKAPTKSERKLAGQVAKLQRKTPIPTDTGDIRLKAGPPMKSPGPGKKWVRNSQIKGNFKFTDPTGYTALRKTSLKHKTAAAAAINAELAGAGAIAKGLQTAASAVGTAIPGNTLPEKFLKDAINFPAVAIPSVYVPAAGAVEALGGHPQRLRRFGQDIKHSDPVYALVTGHPGKALRLAGEHPGFAAAEAAGVTGAAGRTAGRAGRLTGITAASTRRADRTLPGTPLRQKQTYNPDVVRKGAQIAKEKVQAKRVAAKRQQAATLTHSNPQRADELVAAANRIDPTRMKAREIRKRVDERVAVNEITRRQNRARATQQAHAAITNTKIPTGGPTAQVRVRAGNRTTRVKPTAAVTLAAQRITGTRPTDLAAYRKQIAAEHDTLGAAGQRANRELQHQIDKAVKAKSDPKALELAAQRYADVTRPRTRQLVERGMLDKAQAEKAPLIPYATRHMGATHDPKLGLLDHAGEPLSAERIRGHMQAAGVKEPAYVTQAPGQRGARNFYVASHQPPSIKRAVRTGQATRKGTFDAHPDVLIEGAARAQGLIDAADGFVSIVKEFAHKPTLGKLRTHNAAANAARDLTARTGIEYAPIRIQPFAGKQAQLKALLDKASGEGGIAENIGPDHPVKEAMVSAIKGEPGPGPWALIPKDAAAQLGDHLARLGVGPKAKAAQLVSSAFRRTVLATSPSWMTGNITEAALRTAIARAGPRSYITGRKAIQSLQKMDHVAAQELAGRALGGGHFSMADRQHIRRDSSQFKGDTALEPISRALGTFWRAPGPKHVAQAWHAWTDLVFRQLNGRLESQFQTAMLGKALRDSPLMDDHMLKTSKAAIEQAARGLRDTNEQVAMARQVERMYGKYSAFSPDMRWTIATYTPFVAWTLNAMKFVGDVLPRDHPAVLGAIAAAENATQEWRRDHGLDLFIKDQLPGFLQGSIPLSGGRHQRAPFKFTPFGAFGDPLATLKGAVLPQLSGVLAAFNGEDWKGAKLRNPDGSPMDTIGKSKAAAEAFIDSTVPLLSTIKRVSAKGPSALNPLKPVAPASKKARKGRTTSTGPDLTGGIDFNSIDLGGTGGDSVDLNSLDLGQ